MMNPMHRRDHNHETAEHSKARSKPQSTFLDLGRSQKCHFKKGDSQKRNAKDNNSARVSWFQADYYIFTIYVKHKIWKGTRVIRGFKDKKTERFFAGMAVKEFSGFKKVAERKLVMLDSASELRDLLSPPANRLEKLKANELASTVFGLMISGGFALYGKMTGLMTWKLPTITKETIS